MEETTKVYVLFIRRECEDPYHKNDLLEVNSVYSTYEKAKEAKQKLEKNFTYTDEWLQYLCDFKGCEIHEYIVE